MESCSAAGTAVDYGLGSIDPDMARLGTAPQKAQQLTVKSLLAGTGVQLVRGTITRSVQIAIEGHGKFDLANVAADAFGNALGNSIVGAIHDSAAEKQRVEIEANLRSNAQSLNEQLDAQIAGDTQEFNDRIATSLDANINRDIEQFERARFQRNFMAATEAGFTSPSFASVARDAAKIKFEISMLNDKQAARESARPFVFESLGDQIERELLGPALVGTGIQLSTVQAAETYSNGTAKAAQIVQSSIGLANSIAGLATGGVLTAAGAGLIAAPEPTLISKPAGYLTLSAGFGAKGARLAFQRS